MKKIFTIVLFLFGLMISCSNPKSETIESFEFAIYDDLPIFEDEYLYSKEFRKGLKFISDETEWYLIDWNQNGIYSEIGVDYYGVKSPFKNRPIVAILKEENFLKHNEKTFSIEKETNFRSLKVTSLKLDNKISYISNFIPIELTDGSVLENAILESYDKTVIYYWATWCAPCVKKLEQVENNRKQLERLNINFIPIYSGCHLNEVIELNEKKGFNFAPMEVSEKSAVSYQISGLPETYVFDKNGNLIAERFELE